MKVTVVKNLNVRFGEPRLNAPSYQYLAPGSELVIDGKTYKGDKYRGNDNWYRDEANNYYWSGGIKKKNAHIEPNDLTNWVNFFGLSKVQDGLELDKTTVAVLDSGINYNHIDLDGVCSIGKNFLWPEDDFIDNDGHGTHCSGIIAGTGENRITGIARGVKIVMAEVVGVRGMGVNESVLYNAIDWAISHSNIISISLGIPYKSNRIHELIQRGVAANKIFIASIGNVDPNLKSNGAYPALYEEVISVGCLTDNFQLSDLTIRNSNIDINVPGEKIISTFSGSKDSYSEESGTSMSTAIVSGLAALFKTKYPLSNYTMFKDFLIEISEKKIDNGFSYSSIKPKKIIL